MLFLFALALVMLGVHLARVAGVVRGVKLVAVRDVGVMGRLLAVVVAVMLGGLAVMLGRALMMVRGLGVMLGKRRCMVRHGGSLVRCVWRRDEG